MTIDAKKALRAQMRAARNAFAADHGGSIAVPDAFRARVRPGMVVTSYVPLTGEPDPLPFTQVAIDAGCVLALPHVTVRSEPMRFLAWETEKALETGPMGLMQPPLDAAELHPDIILTPLVAFDRSLNRLGQGAGYYDRVFARFPSAWRIGIAWSIQEVDDLPHASWDVPLEAIATECEWITR